MKIAIIGPGALGSLIAASISIYIKSTDTKEDSLWILDRNPQRAALLNTTGFVLEENQSCIQCSIPVTADPRVIGTVDLVLLCVKANDVQDALILARPMLNPDTLFICLQNGIGHLELISSYSSPATLALGVTAQGANLVKPGHVRHAGSGITRIGITGTPSGKTSQRLDRAAALLTESGMHTEISDNIIRHIWNKLLVNVGINALTGIENCPNGMLLESDHTRNQLAAAVQEAAMVAAAKGIAVDKNPIQITEKICRATSRNISSMLQDIRKKRATEIDAINGAIVAEGVKLGILTPVNENLVRRIKAMEQDYLC